MEEEAGSGSSPEAVASAGSKRVRVLLLGGSRVGKASLVGRLLGRPFESEYSETQGVEVWHKEVMMPATKQLLCLELWVGSGATRFLPAVMQNYGAVDAVSLVYDVTRPESLQQCQFWRNEMLRVCPSATMFLVGSKIDLDEDVRVSKESGSKQADAWGMPHMLVSAKTGHGVAAFSSGLLREV